MKKIEAKIICDSVSPQGHRITTFHLTFPRHILAELNTHRMFSRNSASSRAIPFAKMVKMVKEDPFIPIAWQKDHSGMQGKEYITNPIYLEECRKDWLEALFHQIEIAERLSGGFPIMENGEKVGMTDGVTKQIVNRLLEPFMWHSNLVTTTDFENFFLQRCPQYSWRSDLKIGYRSKKDMIKDFAEIGNEKSLPDTSDTVGWLLLSQSPAEIHMQALAEAMWDAMNESTPNQLKAGEWHLPFGENIDDKVLEQITDFKPLNSDGTYQSAHDYNLKTTIENCNNMNLNRVKIVSARCARTSYNNFDGSSDPVKDIKLADGLKADRHRSPLEHAAQCPTEEEYIENIKGVRTIRNNVSWRNNPANGWFNNFHGWIPYRFMIEEEEKKGEPDGTHRY